MKKEEYIKRYGEDAYNEYKKKQTELSRQWRLRNKEKARKYGREYYYKLKSLAMLDEMMPTDTRTTDIGPGTLGSTEEKESKLLLRSLH